MLNAKKNTWRRVVWLILILTYLVNFTYYGRWKTMVTGGGDSWGYYVYLPSALIDHDLNTLQGALGVRERMHPGSTFLEEGVRRAGEAPGLGSHNVIKYTCGVAIMHLPAFVVAHGFASISGKFPADGFSRPYILALYLSSLLYLILGLICVRYILSRYFEQRTVMWVILMLGLGTNLLYFGVINNVMAHPLLFFLWAALIAATIRYYEDRSALRFMIVGLCIGMIVLIRPVEIICVAIPCLFGLERIRDLMARVRLFFTAHRTHLILAVLTAIAVVLPQLIYWKSVAGEWLYYSYPGENFDFTNSRIYAGMFGFLNGWLVYTPLMAFGILGFAVLRKYLKFNTVLLFIVMAVHVFITYAWWNWYYINGFGSRPMVDVYALMAFPLAAFTQTMLRSWLRYLVIPLWLGLVVLNVFQLYQLDKGIMVSDMANRAYYFQIFGKTEFTQQMSVALDLNNIQYDDVTPDTLLLAEDFESDTLGNVHITMAQAAGGKYSYLIHHPENAPQQKWEFAFSKGQFDRLNGQAYLTIRLNVFVERQISSIYEYDAFFIDFVQAGEVKNRQYLRLNNKPGDIGENSVWWGTPHRWYPVTAHVWLPENFSENDRMVFYPNNVLSNSIVYIDDLQFYLSSRE